MTLHDFLQSTGQTPSAFAARLSVAPSTVSRWLSGDRRPSLSVMVRISEITGGAVTAADFMAVGREVA
jgi:transcriptional regulator with XRE-family HTH domain